MDQKNYCCHLHTTWKDMDPSDIAREVKFDFLDNQWTRPANIAVQGNKMTLSFIARPTQETKQQIVEFYSKAQECTNAYFEDAI